MKKILRLSVCPLLLTVFALPLQADFVVNPVFASTDMGADFGTILENTINGVGLSDFPSLTATHTGTTPGDSWVGSVGVLTGTIDFDLGGSFNIDGFSFWNQNGGGPGPAGDNGIADVTVLSSTDGLVFAPIVGAPSLFAQIPGVGPEAPEMFSFGSITATHIRFAVGSNHGNAFNTGFAEVAFHAGAIPEPSTLVFLGIGSVVLANSRRRRR